MELKSFILSDAGKIQVSAYPPSAITFADDEMAHILATRDVKTPWRLFCKIANDWCKERNVVPEWRDMFKALEIQGFNKDTSAIKTVLIQKNTGPVFEGVVPVEENPDWAHIDLWDRDRFISNVAEVIAMVGEEKTNEIAELFAHTDPVSGLNTINFVYFAGDQYGITGNEKNMPNVIAQPPYRKPLTAGAMRSARNIRIMGIEQFKKRYASA